MIEDMVLNAEIVFVNQVHQANKLSFLPNFDKLCPLSFCFIYLGFFY